MLIALLLAAAAASETPAAAVAAPPTAQPGEVPHRRESKRERAINARLVWHRRYDNCVRRNALDIARLDAEPETLAKAAVAFCGEEELDLWSNTIVQCRALGEESDDSEREATCAKRLIEQWRAGAEREAFACIAGTRFKPAAIGVSICKMMEP